MLPQSKEDVIWPEKKKENFKATKLEQIVANHWRFQDGWQMSSSSGVIANGFKLFDVKIGEEPSDIWFPATVPGTVLTTLVDQGVYPDPYYGVNNLHIPDTLSRMDWWYRIPFELPKDPDEQRIWLEFEGINYEAAVWLNGELLGTIAGAFQRRKFDITPIVNKSQENVLAIKIFPPPNPGIPHEQSPRSGMGGNGGSLALDGPTFIASEGWDWVPGIRDRNIGIWQDVNLKYTGDVRLGDSHIITDLDLPDTTKAHIKIKVPLKNYSKVSKKILVTAKIGEIQVRKKITLKAEEKRITVFSAKDFPKLTIKNPRLWWPNGYGNQELYNLELSVNLLENDFMSDYDKQRFGIRELSYELSAVFPDEVEKRFEFNPLRTAHLKEPIFNNMARKEVEPGIFIPRLREGIKEELFKPVTDTKTAPYLVIKVNGYRIFCKGGNWGMDDAMKRVSRERLEPAFKLHKQANYTMIRNWTGESTQKIFYDLADEYGMLVWNDFWLSTENFNLEPLDEQLVLRNATDVIKRYRNHPSIAIWCPRNEGYAPLALEEGFAQIVASEDGTRHYIGNSREINLRQSGPWSFYPDNTIYFKMAGGFSTEVGTSSIPTASTMRKFIPTKDQWPVSDVWYYHDLHKPHNSKVYLETVNEHYGTAENLADFSKKVQLINYDSHRAIFEAWNSRMWDNSTGILLWMTHPAWPSLTWQTYSYDFETPGSYFGAKKACEPLHIQMNWATDSLMAINTTLESYSKINYEAILYNLKGEIIQRKQGTNSFPANSAKNLDKIDISENLSQPRLFRVILKDGEGNLLSQNDYLKSKNDNFQALNDLPNV
jgi:hypothetical protein